MDIAIIIQSLNTHSSSRVPLELAINLAKNNHVTIYSYPYNTDKNLIKTLGRLRVKTILLPYAGKSITNQLKNTFSLSKKLRHANHDIISSHCLPPLFMATWFLQTPTVATYYGTQKNVLTEKYFPKKLSLANIFTENIFNLIIFLEQWMIVNTTSKTITISKYSKNEAHRLYHRKLSYIYLGSISINLKSEQN